ncbi:MAG: 3-dehydroquinate synthase [Actinomycetota bacterium]|nr:3-dehydroquinate synthase [Actinomycetota bacterium]
MADPRLHTVHVALDGAGYDVSVGAGARRELPRLLPPGASRVAIVTQDGIPWDVEPGQESHTFFVPDGEGAKRLAEVERLCSGFARFGLTRADAVVAVGGGVVTDLAGFAAAVYHRGLPFVAVATTLLAQVDAAIGGKCGVNLDEGKNLVGAFWQPSAVLCDTEVLETLPEREWVNGKGEMAKYAFLGVESLDTMPLEQQVVACASHKAAVVASDERESGDRALLNYGHTLAHALEAQGLERGGDIRHGEAVAIGLVFAALLAQRLGRIDASAVDRHVAVVSGLGLPYRLPEAADVDYLLAAMQRDKKALGSLAFVLDGPRGVEVVRGVGQDVVSDVLASMPREPSPLLVR